MNIVETAYKNALAIPIKGNTREKLAQRMYARYTEELDSYGIQEGHAWVNLSDTVQEQWLEVADRRLAQEANHE